MTTFDPANTSPNANLINSNLTLSPITGITHSQTRSTTVCPAGAVLDVNFNRTGGTNNMLVGFVTGAFPIATQANWIGINADSWAYDAASGGTYSNSTQLNAGSEGAAIPTGGEVWRARIDRTNPANVTAQFFDDSSVLQATITGMPDVDLYFAVSTLVALWNVDFTLWDAGLTPLPSKGFYHDIDLQSTFRLLNLPDATSTQHAATLAQLKRPTVQTIAATGNVAPNTRNFVDLTGGAITLTVDAPTDPYDTVYIQRLTPAGNVLTIQPASGTIKGIAPDTGTAAAHASFTMNNQYTAIKLIPDETGSAWIIGS